MSKHARTDHRPPATPPPGARKSRDRWRWLPHIMLGIAILYVAGALRPVGDKGDYLLQRFGSLPVVDQGRIKPLDTLARTSLMVISNKQTTYHDGTSATSERDEKAGHQKVPAIRWLLDVLARPEQARGYNIVRIDHPDVLAIMGVTEERKYFSVHEIVHHGEVLNDQVERARRMDAGDRTPYHGALLRLSEQLGNYFALEDVTGLHLVPPAVGTESWRTIGETHSQFSGAHPPAVESYTSMLTAWHDGKRADFNAAVVGYANDVKQGFPELTKRVRFEQYFNSVSPFIKAMGLYVLVFVLAALSWLRVSRPLAQAALWVLGVALVLHTGGLIARIVIQGRPPVTNLYSSAVFVGWGCVLLGGVLEHFYRNGIGSVTAAVTGFASLLVAHHLSLEGDTMTMMQAVLDTNFWLATHVVVITLGYSSTFLAGFLGTLYIVRGVFTRSLRKEEARDLSRMIYGIICFATLFSFVGTILGGIWADQSWGRFWGWDPKENGALLIVLWNALVLHARWGGMAKQRGLAGLAVAGNIVTAWSWFGTNMLGVGLHSYGFIDSAVFWMFVFIATQLAIIAIGAIPLRHWRSPVMPSRSAARMPAPMDGGKELAVTP